MKYNKLETLIKRGIPVHRIRQMVYNENEKFKRPNQRHFKTSGAHPELKRACITQKRERLNLRVFPTQTPSGVIR